MAVWRSHIEYLRRPGCAKRMIINVHAALRRVNKRCKTARQVLVTWLKDGLDAARMQAKTIQK
jgi:hypothetical protein